MDTNKEYVQFISDLKQNIIQSQYVAVSVANQQQLSLYFRTGKMLSEKITSQKWGSKVVEQIAEDLQKQLPGLKGFSRRNLLYMRQFHLTYQDFLIVQSPTAQMQINENQPHAIWPSSPAKLENPELKAFFGISFTHHILLLNKCKNTEERLFYILHAASQFWSVSVLEHNINAGLFEKQGKLPNNFMNTLPKEISQTSREVFKDEYLMDYLDLDENADERKVESEIVANIKDFILRMGKGFCFIGNQFRIELAGEEFFIDLLFYNRHLQSLVVFDLKRGKFQPEYAGKLNFYLNVLDERIKLPYENPSIGIILCKEKNNTVVEFSIKTINKAMGAASYKTTKEVPKEIMELLPITDDFGKFL